MASIIALSVLINFVVGQTTTQPPLSSRAPGEQNWLPPYPIWTDEDGIYDRTKWTLMGSVVTANTDSIVMHLECPPSTDCGAFPHQTLTYGPSTWKMDMADGPAFTMTQDCDIFTAASPASMVCRESAGGSEANFPGSSTTTYGYGELVVSVTSGWDALPAQNPTGPATATPTAAGVSAKSGSTPSQTLATATKSGVSGTPTGKVNSSAPGPTGAAAKDVVGLGRGVVVAGVGLIAGLVL